MSVIHYKFKNSLEYDSITFDGLAISLADLKKAILQRKRMKSDEVDLQIVNAQTREEYKNLEKVIPKNTSVVISRIPVVSSRRQITPQSKAKTWAAFRENTQAAIKEAESSYSYDKLSQNADLVNSKGSEMDKIHAMMKQATRDFDPSTYVNKFPMGIPSASYICKRCGQSGHFIQACPNATAENSINLEPRVKRSTGIPNSFMMTVSEAIPGAYLTGTGQYAVPTIDAVAYTLGKKEPPPFQEDEEKPAPMPAPIIPRELMCPLCRGLARDAVIIPCCGNSFCDDCVRNALLETEDHMCPSCNETEISPDRLIANKNLRDAVMKYHNDTGYTKVATMPLPSQVLQHRAPMRLQAPPPQRQPPIQQYQPPRPQLIQRPPVSQPVQPPVSQPTQVTRPYLSQSQPPVSVPQPFSSPPPNQYGQANGPSMPSEPPTPTMDEPPPSLRHPPPPHVTDEDLKQGQALTTVVGVGTRRFPVNPAGRPIRPDEPGRHNSPGIDRPQSPPSVAPPQHPAMNFPPGQPVLQLRFPPAALLVRPKLPPTQQMPFPGPPMAVPPMLQRPPGMPPIFPRAALPSAIPTVGAPVLPKPLSEQEFYREKQRLRLQQAPKLDPMEEFEKELQKPRKPKSRSRTRSRSRSRSVYRSRSRSRSRSFSRPRSGSPRRYSPRRYSQSPRYRSPRRSYTPRKSWSRSPRRSRSPLPRYRSFSRSPRRSFTRSRSRSRPRRFSRSRSRSRGPVRYRSFSPRSPLHRGRSWSRGKSPLRRSRSFSRGRSPRFLRPRSRSFTPLRRSLSRGRSPRRSRSRSPFRRSRSRSPFRRRSISPGIRRSWTPKMRSPPLKRSRTRSPRPKSPVGSPPKGISPTRPQTKGKSPPPPASAPPPAVSETSVPVDKPRADVKNIKKSRSKSPAPSKAPAKPPRRRSRSKSPQRSPNRRTPTRRSPKRRRSRSPPRRSRSPPRITKPLSPPPYFGRGRGRGRNRGRGGPWRDEGRGKFGPGEWSEGRRMDFAGGDMNGHDYRGPRRGHSPPRHMGAYPYPPQPKDEMFYSGGNRPREEELFEQYRQYYEYYSRTYGPYARAPGAPGQSMLPPGGPPPMPPGTTTIPLPEQFQSSMLHPDARRQPRGNRDPRDSRGPRSSSPRRHRSRSPFDKREVDRRVRDNRDRIDIPDRGSDRRDRPDKSRPDRKDMDRNSRPSDRSSRDKKATVKEEKDTKPAKIKKDGDKEKKDKKKKVKKEEEVVKKKKKEEKVKEVKSKKKTKPVKEKIKDEAIEEKKDNTVEEASDSDVNESVPVAERKKEKMPMKKETEKKAEQDKVVSSSVSEPDKEKKVKPVKRKIKKVSESEISQSDSTQSDPDSKQVKVKPRKNATKKAISKPVPDESHEKKIKPDDIDMFEPETEITLEPGDKEELKDKSLAQTIAKEDEIMLDPPEVSKWEMEEDLFESSPEPRRQQKKPIKAQEKKMLPRSVIESAEKYMTQKVMKPSTAVSSVSSTVVKTKEVQVKEKERDISSKDIRAVSRDREATTKESKDVRERSRDHKEGPHRENSSRDVRDRDTREKSKDHARRDTRETDDKTKRRVYMGDVHDQKDDRKILSRQHSMQVTVSSQPEKRSIPKVGDLRLKLIRDKSKPVKDKKTIPVSSSDSREVDDRKRSHRDYEEIEPVPRRSVSRKESTVIDEAKFVPDYEEDSDISGDEQRTASSGSDSGSSDDEDTSSRKQKSETDHKHKHKKSKHKKNKKHKHKHKKKKHKKDKEAKLKSSIVVS